MGGQTKAGQVLCSELRMVEACVPSRLIWITQIAQITQITQGAYSPQVAYLTRLT